MKKHIKNIAIAVLIGSLTSCFSNEEKTRTITNANVKETGVATQTELVEQKKLKAIHVCTQRPPLIRESNKAAYAAIIEAKKWTWAKGEKRNVYVLFLDGRKDVQDKVAAIARKWEPVAHINFIYTNDKSKADIKISFQHSEGGSWSYLGIDSKQYDTSMNFGWLNSTPLTDDFEFNRVVLHEFGHALGLIHEHQNPNGNPIKWNKKAVYYYYTINKIFTKEEVEANIFNMEENVNGTKFDPNSIMLYAFPAEFTMNRYATKWNAELSAMDKDFIGNKAYRIK